MPPILRLPAVSAALAVALAAGSVSAATVVQSQSFDFVTSATTHSTSYAVNHTDSLGLHFDGFDPSLGALTGVTLALTSARSFETGVSLFGGFGAAVTQSGSDAWVKVGGDLIDFGPPLLIQGTVLCRTEGQGLCAAVAHANDTYDFTAGASDLAPFLALGGVDVSMDAGLGFTGLAAGDDIRLATAVASLLWTGDLTVTYAYDAAATPPGIGVPEPSIWATMVTGFALAGSALRRRRASPV